MPVEIATANFAELPFFQGNFALLGFDEVGVLETCEASSNTRYRPVSSIRQERLKHTTSCQAA